MGLLTLITSGLSVIRSEWRIRGKLSWPKP